MIIKGASFIMTIKSKESIKIKKRPYCQRCGGFQKANFQIQLTPSRLINVCTSCFNWARDKTPKEIREDYAKRTKRKKNI